MFKIIFKNQFGMKTAQFQVLSHSLMIFVGDELGKRAFMQIGQLVKRPDERKVPVFYSLSPNILLLSGKLDP